MIDKKEKNIMKNWDNRDKPLLSILCVTFNHEKYIEKTLDSFLMQETNFPFEIIIHDDASTDRTADIVREYEREYPNIITAIYQKENQFSKNINPVMQFLLPNAKGEYISISDGDDYWIDKDKLQIQIDKMKKYPECDMSFHPAYELIDKTNKFGKVINKYANEDKIFSTREVVLGRGGFCPTASLVLRKRALDDLSKWYNTLDTPGDYMIQIYGALRGGALYINRVMSIYRIDVENSWCSTKNRNSTRALNILYATNKALCTINSRFDNRYSQIMDRAIFIHNLDFVKKRSVAVAQREEVFKQNRDLFSLRDRLLWYLIYKNETIFNSIAYLKRAILFYKR